MTNITDSNAIGKRVKEIRKSRNLTQFDFGEEIGLSQTAVSKIEKGKVGNVSIDTLLTISMKFDVSAEYLLYGNDSSILQLLEKYISFEYDNLSTSETNTYHYPKIKINKSFFDYLVNSESAKQKNNAPDNIRKMWINQLKEEFNKKNKSSEETEFVEFVPVPQELIYPDDNKSKWNQADLIREIDNRWNNKY